MKKLIFLFLCSSLFLIGQAQVSKTINVKSAGKLKDSLSVTERNTITNLTVTGTINILDLITIRDMVLLNILDISGATIVAYSTYLANEIPANLFFNSATSTGKTSLSSISLPTSCTSIGSAAFKLCTNLTSITMSNAIVSIGNDVFSGCIGFTTFKLPSSLLTIGDYAFYGCKNLTSMTIPNAVTQIGSLAFCNCTGLTNLSLGSSLTTLGKLSFGSCTGLTNLSIGTTVGKIGIGIGDSAFAGCTGLLNISIGNAVGSIGNNAFENCSKLSKVTIPSSVSSIGSNAFYLCDSLSNFTVENTNPSYSSLEGVLFNRSQTTLIRYPPAKKGDYIIPNGVSSIGYYSFDQCNNLIRITIPSTVTSVGDYAFNGCSGLKTIYSLNAIPPTLGFYSFYYVLTVTDVFVPTDAAVLAYKSNAGWIQAFTASTFKKITPSATPEITKKNLVVYIKNSNIWVEGTSVNEKISLYSDNGAQIQIVKSNGECIILPAKKGKVYLVKTALKTFKVIV